MPWRRRRITPNFMPFGKDGRTYDPNLVVETRRVDNLNECPIWHLALLTDGARRDVPPFVRQAWHVRRRETVDPFATVVMLNAHTLGGRILSRTPEQATIARTDRFLVIMPQLVLTVHASDPARAYRLLADIIAGTRRRPRIRRRTFKGPAEDLAAILPLAP